ncbi:hypothetical protein [Armatimonas sp.]|uniref:hypothetical protein n=1 Tax=Armatimonas sp. TaxID=1872638 RepID=UPI00374DC2D3
MITPTTAAATGSGPPSWQAVVLYFVLLMAGVGLQATVSSHLGFLGAQPDFLLALALCVALLTDAPLGASAGFLSGLMMAAISGQTMGTYLVTRTVAAWLVGGLRKRFVRAGVLVTLLGVGVGSLIAGLLYGLSVPRIGLYHWLSLTFVGAGLNMFVALPVAVLLRWQTRT